MKTVKFILHSKEWLIAGIVGSLIIYAIILAGQLKEKLECAPTDGMCNSANTVSGDIIWSVIFSGLVLVPAWILGVCIYNIVSRIITSKQSK